MEKKSHLLKPLLQIFGSAAFARPCGQSNFPLQNIFGKKVCVLQDLRVSTFKMGFDSLLVWWQGESFPAPLPRNMHKEDVLYTEAAGSFASAGQKLRIPLKEAWAAEVDPAAQNEMMDARWRYFHFPVSLDKGVRVDISPCPKCFATWLVEPGSGSCQAAVTLPICQASAGQSCCLAPSMDHAAREEWLAAADAEDARLIEQFALDEAIQNDIEKQDAMAMGPPL